MSRDMWAELSSAFAEAFPRPDVALTPERLEDMADAYQREQIATARSEAAQEAARKEYAK